MCWRRTGSGNASRNVRRAWQSGPKRPRHVTAPHGLNKAFAGCASLRRPLARGTVGRAVLRVRVPGEGLARSTCLPWETRTGTAACAEREGGGEHAVQAFVSKATRRRGLPQTGNSGLHLSKVVLLKPWVMTQKQAALLLQVGCKNQHLKLGEGTLMPLYS